MEPQLHRKAGAVNILGVEVDDISLNQVVESILLAARRKDRIVAAYVNIHAINLANDYPDFKEFLNSAEIVFCDGFGVSLAAMILYGRRIERFTPPDWLPKLAKGAAKDNLSFFLLGGRPGIAEKGAARLVSGALGLRLAGTFHGYFNKSRTSEENLQVLETIRRAGPDILLVGFGMPAQERWIRENWEALNVGAVMPVGAAFDYLAGEVKRAPAWMTNSGFEWLGRLLIEPGRLWKRYIIGNPLFFWRIFRQKIGMM
jgi:N-acetylglucosaminyldiphosphoundecaprenol N-acetyl-beta-D-mannosaminyltransferase